MTLPLDFSLFNPTIVGLTLGATILAGLAKSGFGGALASGAVPLMTLGMPPLLAVSILLPVLCTIDLFTVRAYWRQWDRRSVLILIPAALFGVLVGALTFRFMSDAGLRAVIGLVALVFGLRQLQQLLQAGKGQQSLKPATAAGRNSGLFWGAVAGYTSHVAHAGGVPLAVWLLRQGLDRRAYVATSAIFFLFANYSKLLPYSLNGQFSPAILTLAAAMAPVALLMVLLGVRINRFIPDRPFYFVVAAGLLLSGAKLLLDAGIAVFG